MADESVLPENNTPGNVPLQKKEEIPDAKQPLPRIRTYAADMSRVIKDRGATLSTIITEEKQNQKKPARDLQKEKNDRKRLLYAAGAVALVILGIGIIAGTWLLLPKEPEFPEATESIIFANHTKGIEVGIDDARGALASARTDVDMSLGEITRLIPTQNGVPLSPQETAARLGLPAALTREVTDIMVGVHAFDRNQPFIIMRISAYDRSFNALLSSERDLARLLGDFFRPHNVSTDAPSLTFNDEIIRNLDVRRSAGEWSILYSYPERLLLVITTNEFTLREVMSRLSNQRR